MFLTPSQYILGNFCTLYHWQNGEYSAPNWTPWPPKLNTLTAMVEQCDRAMFRERSGAPSDTFAWSIWKRATQPLPEKKCSICRRRSQGSARPAPAAPMNGLRPPLTPPPSDAGGQISGAWQPPCRASGTNFILQKTICEKLLTVPGIILSELIIPFFSTVFQGQKV